MRTILIGCVIDAVNEGEGDPHDSSGAHPEGELASGGVGNPEWMKYVRRIMNRQMSNGLTLLSSL